MAHLRTGSSSKRPPDPVRIAALVVVLAAHVAVIAVLLSRQSAVRFTGAPENESLFVFFVPSETDVPPVEAAPAPRARKKPTDKTPSISPSAKAPTQPAVDWWHEAELAGRRHADALDDEDKRSATFPGAVLQAPPPAKPEFGWSHERTHRVERLEEGGMLVWINDRCALIFTPLPLAGCEIGKKPARGDLFEHMDDAVTGDWKE